MDKIRVAIVGYGNIGRYALQALQASPDMECAGVVRRSGSADGFPELQDLKVVSDVAGLGTVDVAILATPSRKVGETAVKYISKGISTVDSFDIHTRIADLRTELMPIDIKNGAVSIISAGWDPGTDSVVRALLEAMAPSGDTYTNFGPGRSMGHTVAAKAVPGVKNALSITLPLGKGIHGRKVYVEIEQGCDPEEVKAAIKSDPYFVHDDTEVVIVDDVDALNTVEHGVNLVREGACSTVGGQKFAFDMRINNPALTGQVLVSCARAATRQRPGCYTLPEIAPIDLLPGDREELIRKLV